MENKRGRPPKPKAERGTELIALRMTTEERQQCEQAAEQAELSLSAWIRGCCLRAAKRAAKQK